MSVSIVVRLAQPEDRPSLVILMAALQDLERSLSPHRLPGEAISDAHLAYLEAQINQYQGRIFVAASSSGILGFLVGFVEAFDPGDLHVPERDRTYGYISDLYVLPKAQHQRVGSALMHAAEQHFRSLGLNLVKVELLPSNIAAAQFYEKAGYQPEQMIYSKRWEHPQSH
jgi:ribosomal protein S18 acetylase RimI-like enzyme